MAESIQIRVLERAIDILDVLKHHAGNVSLSTISRETSIAKTTVFRILQTLCSRGYVRQEPGTNHYVLGYKLLELSFSAATQWEFISLAQPYLDRLRDELNETTALAIKSGIYYAFIARALCRNEYRVTPVMGERYYLHWAGTGKAILAYASAEEVEAILALLPSTAVTGHTLRDPAELNEQLTDIRQTGCASSFSERIEGGASYSTAILDKKQKPVAAISVVGPEIRLKKMDRALVCEKLQNAARALETAYRLAGVDLEAAENYWRATDDKTA